jgi:hypothetical protein
MIRKLFSSVAFALVVVSLLSSATFASVTFDAATGTGFVGKGDVQDAFGWNDSVLQQNAGGISFTYATQGELTQMCESSAGKSEVRTKAFTREVDVTAAITSASRKNPNGKGTGFNLTGYVGSADADSMPTDICPNSTSNNRDNDPWHPVSPVTFVAGEAGGLFVNFGDQSVLLD